MEVTYIGHSGFLVEWGACYWLFDYYTGEIPELDAGKRVFVFASHNHGDHWNPKSWTSRKHPDVHYVLSSDIELREASPDSKAVTAWNLKSDMICLTAMAGPFALRRQVHRYGCCVRLRVPEARVPCRRPPPLGVEGRTH